jgi:hypothetical protein
MKCKICGRAITQPNAKYKLWCHVQSTYDLHHRAEPDLINSSENTDTIFETVVDDVFEDDPITSTPDDNTDFSFGGSDDGFSGGGGGDSW